MNHNTVLAIYKTLNQASLLFIEELSSCVHWDFFPLVRLGKTWLQAMLKLNKHKNARSDCSLLQTTHQAWKYG